MEPIDPVLLELEPFVRANLGEYLRRDLDREYQPKHRSRANKLGPQALEELRLSGEQLQVLVRDQGQLHKVDMTFPLFDLDSDFTFIQCTCLRDALSLEPIRCHHMFLAQTGVAHRLALIKAQPVAEDSLGVLQQLLSADGVSPVDEEHLLLEQRWLFLWEASTGGLSAERYTRNRFDREASWQRQGRWPSSELLAALSDAKDELSLSLRAALIKGANRPDRELFEVLRLLEGHHAMILEQRETREPIAVQLAPWHLGIREELEGFRLQIEIGPKSLPPWKLVSGAGLIAFDEPSQVLYLSGLDMRSEALVQGVMQQNRLIPLASRELMLDFIEKLDPGIAVLWAEQALQRVENFKLQPMLRLSPFQRGGMKVEVWLQLSAGTSVRAGVGPEELRERSRRGPLRQFIRDFSAERILQRKLERLLDLEILPSPEPSVFIAYNDEVALALMAHIEEHKQDLQLLIEWPAALAGQDKPSQRFPCLPQKSGADG